MSKIIGVHIPDGIKNYLMNGDMRIAQRGNSFVAAANDTFMADRWRYNKVSGAVHTLTTDSDVPSAAQAGYLFQNSLRFNLTTPDTSLTANEFVSIRQQLEGYVWANLAQKQCTLSFWVKATLPGTYCVSLENFSDRSFVQEYTINGSNTWEFKVISIPASPAAGTWNYTNSTGIAVRWTIASAPGSTFTAPSTGSWLTGSYISTANQVNGVNTGATDFRITGTMLNEGPMALPFRLFAEGIDGELAAVQRYYEKSNPLNTAPNAASGADQWVPSVYTDGTRVFTTVIPFKVPKRANPTISIWSTSGLVSGSATFRISGSTETVACTQVADEKKFSNSSNNNLLSAAFNNTNASSYGAGFSWEANSEL